MTENRCESEGSYSKRTSQVKEDVVQEGIETKGPPLAGMMTTQRSECESSSSQRDAGSEGA